MKGKGLQEGDVLFVVVCEDRHISDVIGVYATRASADEAVDAFLLAYSGDRYDFQEDEETVAHSKRMIGNEWVRYVCDPDSDDGPKARIELTKLRGAP